MVTKEYGLKGYSCFVMFLLQLIFFSIIVLYSNSSRAEECNKGYYKSGNNCLPVKIPQNAELDIVGHGWTCQRGYYQSGAKCLPVQMPANAELDIMGHGWTCNDGFKKSGSKCVRMSAEEKAKQEEINRKLYEEILRRRAMRYSVYGNHSDECEDALDEADSAADDLEIAARRLVNCASNHDFSDDCSSEFYQTRSAYSDYESALSEVSYECD